MSREPRSKNQGPRSTSQDSQAFTSRLNPAAYKEKKVCSWFAVRGSWLMRCHPGYILIELLVAVMLFSVAATGLYTSSYQGLRTDKKIRESFQRYDPLRTAFMQLDHDLRRSIALPGLPFKGSRDAIEFPAAVEEKNNRQDEETRMYLIRYFKKGDALFRSQQAIGDPDTKPEERAVLAPLTGVEFFFAYQSSEEKAEFRNFWLEEPYEGLPRYVKIHVEREVFGEKTSLDKWVSIPHGQWGHFYEP